MAEDNGQISAKQITMVLGLVTTIAGAVAGCLMMLYGTQIDNISEDSAADLLRLEGQIQRLDDDCDFTQITDLHNAINQINDVLETKIRPAVAKDGGENRRPS